MEAAQVNTAQFLPVEARQDQGNEPEVIQQERNHLLGAHVTEFARNSMRRIATGAAVCVAAFGASEMANPATAEAKAKAMTPESVVRDIQKVQYKYMERKGGFTRVTEGINVRKATVTADTLTLKGKCNPRNLYEPGIKNIIETPKARKIEYCSPQQGSYTAHANDRAGMYTPDSYSADIDKLGDRAAVSAGIDDASHGSATKITATKRSARISFEPIAATSSEGMPRKQLQTLIIRKGKKPVEKWYSTSELAKIAPEATQTVE